MKRIGLKERKLPVYTKGEETMNMVSHIVGGGIGVVMLLICAIVAAWNHNVWGLVSGMIYGFSVILLFTMSSLYHGLKAEIPKKVFQIIDHCAIFILIAGTYTPVLLGRFRELYPVSAWVMFGVIWGLALIGVALNSIDLKKYRKLSLACYLGMGWCVVFRLPQTIESVGMSCIWLLLTGGIFYTIGAALYVAGKKKKYMHSVFHIFVNIATLLHFLAIVIYVIPFA